MTESRNIKKLKVSAQSTVAAPEMTREVALQRALYRVAQQGLGLPVTLLGAHMTEVGRSGVLAGVDDGDLIVQLEQDGDLPGVMALNFELLSALVEVQTLGVVGRSAAQPRGLTSTDAAVALPLIDGTLSGFEALLPEFKDAPCPGFHFGAWVKSPTLLAAHLPDGGYDLFEVMLEIGTGQRQGRLLLALPQIVETATEAPETEPTQANSERFQHEVLESQVRLDVVLHRLEIPVGEVGAFKPGDLLTIPLRSLSEVSLYAGGKKPVATGILGQLSGARAVCLTRYEKTRGSSQTPAQTAGALADVDLADPGLLSPKQAPPQRKAEPQQERPPLTPPQTEGAPVNQVDTGEILRELGLTEDILSSGVATQTKNPAHHEGAQGGIASGPLDVLPGQDQADG